jgi:hypothetical protein
LWSLRGFLDRETPQALRPHRYYQSLRGLVTYAHSRTKMFLAAQIKNCPFFKIFQPVAPCSLGLI